MILGFSIVNWIIFYFFLKKLSMDLLFTLTEANFGFTFAFFFCYSFKLIVFYCFSLFFWSQSGFSFLQWPHQGAKNLMKTRARCSNSTENFKRPKNREDSSDLDEKLSESIAATQTFIWKSLPRHSASKTTFSKKIRTSRGLNILYH